MADRNKDETSEILRSLAKIFREGKVVYDRNGRSLLEWEKYFNKKKQANARTQPRRADDVNRECGTEAAIRRWLQ
jgi:hypothetical protein